MQLLVVKTTSESILEWEKKGLTVRLWYGCESVELHCSRSLDRSPVTEGRTKSSWPRWAATLCTKAKARFFSCCSSHWSSGGAWCEKEKVIGITTKDDDEKCPPASWDSSIIRPSCLAEHQILATMKSVESSQFQSPFVFLSAMTTVLL